MKNQEDMQQIMDVSASDFTNFDFFFFFFGSLRRGDINGTYLADRKTDPLQL